MAFFGHGISLNGCTTWVGAHRTYTMNQHQSHPVLYSYVHTHNVRVVYTLSLLCLRNFPVDLSDLFRVYSDLHKDSSAPPLTQELSTSSARKNETFGNRSFSYAAPSVWNSLPREIRYNQSTTACKTALKTHLFQSYNHWQTLYPLHSPLLTVFVDFLRSVRSVCA